MRFTTIQQSVFFGLLIIVTVGFLFLIRDFLMPVFWAIVFAIIFYPLYGWWLRVTRERPSLSSFLTIITITLLIFTPLFFLGSMVVKESVDYYQQFAAGGTINILEKATVATDYLQQLGIEREQIQEGVASAAKAASSWLAAQAISFGQNTFKITLSFFFMLYLLFFTLRDGIKLRKRLIEILPLGYSKEKRLFKKFASTTRATIKGTFLIALIQGALGGMLFFAVGINAPFVWGSIMGVLSVIPAIGPGIIWLPAGIILLVSGSIWQGIFVLVAGGLVISLIDNALRPIFVGKDTEMPDFLILLSTFGGLSVFGITGFIIGPIIAAFFLSMWNMFEEEYKKDLSTRG